MATPTTAPRATTELAAALRPAILRLGRRLRQLRDDDLGLTSTQLSAMGLLMSGDLLMGELAALELVRPPSMTRVVNGLEELGLVARRADPRDGRSSVVGLTDAGRQLLLANRRRRTEWLALRLAELEPEERDVLRRAATILEKVNHA